MTTPSAAAELPRTLGTFDIAFTAVGIVVGSGIFLVPGLVLGHSGSNTLIALSVWTAGGILTLFGALTYAELATVRPHAGGIYVYIRDAFGPLPAFLYGWSAFFVIATGALATLAVAFSTYLGQLVPLTRFEAKGIAVLLIAALAGLNIAGTRRSITLQNVTTVAKIAAVAAIALLLIARGDPGAAFAVPAAAPAATVASFGTAMISVLWAYEGWQYVTALAADTREPQRTYPRALGLAIGGVLFLYVLTNFAYVAALGPEGAAASQRIAADALVARVSLAAANGVSLLILLSILSSANGSVLAPSRIYFAMARDGVFFERLARISPRYGTPAFATGAGAAWAMVGAAIGSFEQLLTYVVFAAWIFYGLAALSIFVYRRREPDHPRPFRVPWYPLTPLLFVVSAALLVLNTVVAQPARAAVGIVIVLSGTPAYYWWRTRSRSRPVTV